VITVGGYWMGGSGGFVDMVGLQLGLSYIEMIRKMYTVSMKVQLLELEHKCVISPAPTSKGVIALGVVRKVPDESMYNHQWVRNYSLAKTMIDIGMNSGQYANLTFPGGSSINFELFLSKGEAMVEKLEKQLLEDHLYSEPADFFIG
jgi:hypothetical protein